MSRQFFFGEKEKVNELISWCRKCPELAEVDSLIINEGEGEFDGFEIKD